MRKVLRVPPDDLKGIRRRRHFFVALCFYKGVIGGFAPYVVRENWQKKFLGEIWGVQIYKLFQNERGVEGTDGDVTYICLPLNWKSLQILYCYIHLN